MGFLFRDAIFLGFFCYTLLAVAFLCLARCAFAPTLACIAPYISYTSPFSLTGTPLVFPIIPTVRLFSATLLLGLHTRV